MNGLAQVAAKYPNTTVIFADKTERLRKHVNALDLRGKK
jgi:hypothetical protein